MTTINSIGFQCRNCRQDTATYHPLPAIASSVIPGSGQLMKGDNWKGFGHLLTDVGLLTAGGLAIKHIMKKSKEALAIIRPEIEAEHHVNKLNLKLKFAEEFKGYPDFKPTPASDEALATLKKEAAAAKEAALKAGKKAANELKNFKRPKLALITVPLAMIGLGINHFRSAANAYQPSKTQE